MVFRSCDDLAKLAKRDDVFLSHEAKPDVSFWRRSCNWLSSMTVFAAGTLLVAVTVYVPVLAVRLAQIEAVEIADERVPLPLFLEELGNLFVGVSLLALALTSFIASVRLAEPPINRPASSHPMSSEDATFQLAVLRLLRMER